jgi:cell division protein ZapE
MGMFMEHAADIGARRIHMHAFMPELHKRLVAVRVGDPVQQMAKDLAHEFRVLGFDEFFVSNLGDGVMLGRLFEFLFREGVSVVATSNWPIEHLFTNGRNRQRLLPYIRLLQTHMTAVDLGNGQDYRQTRDPRWPLYVLASAQEPATPELQVLFDQYAAGASDDIEAAPAGIKATALRGRCGWYQFADICEHAFGRLAYLELTDRLDTIVLEGVPELDEEDSDAALRLTTLVDICYERRCRMIVSALVYPSELYAGGPVLEAFRRVASRLAEMQSWA